MASTWNSVSAAYLLRRAGFGPTASEVAAFTQIGREAAVARLVDYQNIDNSDLEARLRALDLAIEDDLLQLYFWWVYRMLYTARPLEEKLTLFWHGHFATSYNKVPFTNLMLAQNRTLRTRAMGSFLDLLVDVARDPAMIILLDTFTSVKEAPNENFARELLELYGLGIGNYTEQDIQEIARCFTGWTLRSEQFLFNATRHDIDPKTVFGQTFPANRGIQDGLDVCRLVADHPACAPFLAGKLWRYFAAGPLPERVRAAMTSAFTANDHSVREMLRAMFLADEFYTTAVADEQIKSPVEIYVGTLRSLEADRNLVELRDLRTFPLYTALMGQTLFLPPSVAGWDAGRRWINTSTLLARYNFANIVVTLRGEGFQFVDPARLLGASNASTPDQVVDFFATLLGPLDLGAAARARLADYLRARPDGTPGEFSLTPLTIDTKVRGLLKLLLATPQFQTNAVGPQPGLSSPRILSPALKNGKLLLVADGSAIQQGAHLHITGESIIGTESFELALNAKGSKWTVARRATSVPGGQSIEALLSVAASFTLVVENPDGGQSEPVRFAR